MPECLLLPVNILIASGNHTLEIANVKLAVIVMSSDAIVLLLSKAHGSLIRTIAHKCYPGAVSAVKCKAIIHGCKLTYWR